MVTEKDFRFTERKGNYFKVELIEGDEVTILVNTTEVIKFVMPYGADLKGYMSTKGIFSDRV